MERIEPTIMTFFFFLRVTILVKLAPLACRIGQYALAIRIQVNRQHHSNFYTGLFLRRTSVSAPETEKQPTEPLYPQTLEIKMDEIFELLRYTRRIVL